MITNLLKAIAIIFALVLLGFAGFQVNDPDPIAWVSFYFICALVPLLLVFNIYYPPLVLLAMGTCLLRLIIVSSGAFEYYQLMGQEPLMQSMNPDKPYIEEAREFLGALIALVLVAASALMARSRYLKIHLHRFKGKKDTFLD